MSKADTECGAQRASAVQRTILRCEAVLDHRGDHHARTEWGRDVRWPDTGRLRFQAGRPDGSRSGQSTVEAAKVVKEAAGPGLSAAGRRAARTERQAEVLRWLVAGADVASIAGALGIGTSRVREIAQGMAVRLGTTSVDRLISLARAGGESEAGRV